MRGITTVDDCANDGGEELFTKMRCVLELNSYRIVKDTYFDHNASW